MIIKTLGHYQITSQSRRTRGRADILFAGSIAWLCLFWGLFQSENLLAQNKNLRPEEVVARHLQSIGTADVLRATKSRVVTGTTSVDLKLGGFGKLSGRSLIVSEGRKLAISMRYPSLEYPGEHFAFDGKDVTIGYIDFGQRSNIGEFIRQFSGLVEEGLLGGTLSLSWPLLDVEERRPKLKYRQTAIDGRRLHELDYSPKSRSGMEGLVIRLFFDFDTFRHVSTEYRYYSAMDSNKTQVLKERFDGFKEVDGMTLPHKYTIEYSSNAPSFIGHWILAPEECLHNFQTDPEIFRAPRTPR